MSNQVDDAQGTLGSAHPADQINPEWKSLAGARSQNRRHALEKSLDMMLEELEFPVTVGRLQWADVRGEDKTLHVVCSQTGETLGTFKGLLEAHAIAGIINRMNEQVASLRVRLLNEREVGRMEGSAAKERIIQHLQETISKLDAALTVTNPTPIVFDPAKLDTPEVGKEAAEAALAVEEVSKMNEDTKQDTEELPTFQPLFMHIDTGDMSHAMKLGTPVKLESDHENLVFLAWPDNKYYGFTMSERLSNKDFRIEARAYQHAGDIPAGHAYVMHQNVKVLDHDEEMRQLNCLHCRRHATPAIDNRKTPGS